MLTWSERRGVADEAELAAAVAPSKYVCGVGVPVPCAPGNGDGEGPDSAVTAAGEVAPCAMYGGDWSVHTDGEYSTASSEVAPYKDDWTAVPMLVHGG